MGGFLFVDRRKRVQKRVRLFMYKDEQKDNRAEYETESEADEKIPYFLCCDLFENLEITGWVRR